jgi:hypothetical protein
MMAAASSDGDEEAREQVAKWRFARPDLEAGN